MALPANVRKASRTASGPQPLQVHVHSLLLPGRRVIRELTTLICCVSLWSAVTIDGLSLLSQSESSRTTGQGVCVSGTVRAKEGRSGRAYMSQHVPNPKVPM